MQPRRIWIGISLQVLGSLLGTVGKQLMRYSKISEDRHKLTQARWCLTVGMILNIGAGPILEVIAFGQAPQMLPAPVRLAPIQGLDVIWNVVPAAQRSRALQS